MYIYFSKLNSISIFILVAALQPGWPLIAAEKAGASYEASTTADAGISVSGVAGPGGGSDEKPVGTVWIAVGFRDRMVHTQKFLFEGDRSQVRLQAVEAALQSLLALVEQTRRGRTTTH